MSKRRLGALIILPVVFLFTFLLLSHLEVTKTAHKGSPTPVAEARTYPVKTPMPGIQRILGAQILVFRSTDYAQVENSIKDLVAAGVNTLIVRAFQNRGDRIYRFARPRCTVGVYFKTTHAPVVDPVLTQIVALAHRYGLRVFAWMETRKMPLLLTDPKASRAISYRFESKSYGAVPQWSIFDKAVEKRLIGLYHDVALSGVDGILIQDDLVMRQNEDFSLQAVTLFEKETGKLLSPKNLYSKVFQDNTGYWCVPNYSDTFWQWACWKNQKLLDLARKLILSARGVNPEIKIAMNFMYESVTNPKNALAWLSQSLAEATRLPIDYYAIMAYHRQIREELRLSEEATYNKIAHMTATMLKLVDNPHKVLMKVQMADWKTRKQISPYEANQVFNRINSQGRVSLAFIPYSPTLPLNVIGHYFR